jgi:CoA:oxalate CoA-transferase
MNHPLSGIRVLDLSQVYNGPYATYLMATAGADVIKIEPPGGEFLRQRDARPGSSIPFTMLNGNKRSVSLNLKTEAGRDLFLKLVPDADVVLENFAPGVMARLKIDYETLSAINPRVVFASGSGYGQTGPYRDYPAMDLTVQAMSGVVSSTGFSEHPPVKAGAAICDFFGGVHLYGAVVTALFQRERTGIGAQLDVSMLDAVYPSLASSIGGAYGESDDLPPRTGNQHGGLSLCPYNIYQARDGYIAVLCNHEKHWQALLRAMQRSDLAEHPQYSSMRGRVEQMAQVDALIDAWTRTLDRSEVFDRLIAERVPCAPVRELAETLDDPHMHERGMLMKVAHPTFGEVTICRSPLKFVGQPPPAWIMPPTYGQHNEEIYGGDLGLDSAKLAALSQQGVI